jgi:hypothetical protein
VRITLTDSRDPGSVLHQALLNPGTLSFDGAAEIGELNPVGASHSVLQYGHTKSPDIPIELYFSRAIQGRQPEAQILGSTAIYNYDVTEPVRWLSSFLHSPSRGVAPSWLLLLWPGVADVALAVRRVNPIYTRFARDLRPIAATVSIEAKELRFSFKTAESMRTYGFAQRDPQLKYGTSISGQRLNLAGGKTRGNR